MTKQVLRFSSHVVTADGRRGHRSLGRPDSLNQACIRIIASILLALVIAGCSSKPPLMATPKLYTRDGTDPFAEVPPSLQSNRIEVLYLTDRVATNDSTENRIYGYGRSRSVAAGVCEVQIGQNGKDISWDDLVKASRSSKRSMQLELSVIKTTDVVQFGPTPSTLIEKPEPPDSATQPTTTQPNAAPPTIVDVPLVDITDPKIAKSIAVLSERLSRTPVKDVYVYVHGYNNDFQSAVTTIAGLWHFLGRQGVPVAYSWPAGRGGLLRGYNYDRESSEFTVYHLKEALKLIASCPDVQRVNLIAHSRGTDVTISALRELHLEIGGNRRDGGRATRDALKLHTLVLAAPDLDLDVVIQRLGTARLSRVFKHYAIYISSQDSALGVANWLFGGMTRLGKIKPKMFTEEELEALRKSRTIQIIDAQVSDAGSFGHDYFYSNPSVSSDLIMLMRYQLRPGAEFGRPLHLSDSGFWVVNDSYPEQPSDQKDSGGK